MHKAQLFSALWWTWDHTSRISACGCFLAVVLGMCVAAAGNAANITGKELLAECSAAHNSVHYAQCVSYIAGVIDGVDALVISSRLLHPGTNAYPKMYCLPAGANAVSLVVPLVAYMQKHPSDLRFGAPSEVIVGLMRLYPCLGDATAAM